MRFAAHACFALLLVGLLAQARAGAAQAHVAVAANFVEPLKALAQVLQRTTGHTLKLTPGATGKLYAQIQNGAPFDVLLAADAATPAALEAQGLAQPGTRFTYAQGQLVLWSAQVGRVDGAGRVLTAPDLGKVSHANPKVSPYGAATVQALHRLGLGEALRPKLVQGESIGQAYTFAHTGNADVGFVALSQVMHRGVLKGGSMWAVPPHLHDPIRQDAVLLKKAAANPAALALLALLQSAEGKALVRAHGYAI